MSAIESRGRKKRSIGSKQICIAFLPTASQAGGVEQAPADARASAAGDVTDPPLTLARFADGGVAAPTSYAGQVAVSLSPLGLHSMTRARCPAGDR